MKNEMSPEYSNREIDIMLKELHEKLDDLKAQNNSIIIQTTKTNGRVSKLERYLLVVGVVTATLLFTNGSELVDFVMKVI